MTIADHEKQLLRLLKPLGRVEKSLFALLCAERLRSQIANDDRFTPYAATAAVASACLWNALSSGEPTDPELGRQLARCEVFLGPEVELWAHAEHSITALAFALQIAIASDDVAMRPVWSAFSIYDALLHHLVTVGEDVVDPVLFWRHPLVAAETERELRDLADIRSRSIAMSEMRARAEREKLGVRLLSRW